MRKPALIFTLMLATFAVGTLAYNGLTLGQVPTSRSHLAVIWSSGDPEVANKVCLRIPGQVGHLFQSKLATHSDVKLAICSDTMLATFPGSPEWVANIIPELAAGIPESFLGSEAALDCRW